MLTCFDVTTWQGILLRSQNIALRYVQCLQSLKAIESQQYFRADVLQRMFSLPLALVGSDWSTVAKLLAEGSCLCCAQSHRTLLCPMKAPLNRRIASSAASLVLLQQTLSFHIAFNSEATSPKGRSSGVSYTEALEQVFQMYMQSHISCSELRPLILAPLQTI